MDLIHSSRHLIFPQEWSHAKIRSECISFRRIVNARNSRAMTSSLSRLDYAPSIILLACLLSFDRGRRTLLFRMSEIQVIVHTAYSHMQQKLSKRNRFYEFLSSHIQVKFMRFFHRESLNYWDRENNFWKKITCIPAIAMPRNTNVKLSHCNQFVTFLRQPWKYIALLGRQ